MKFDRRTGLLPGWMQKQKLRAKQAFALARWQGPLLQYRDFLLTGGVASSYQSRDPWPIYLSPGKGSKVWDVDGTEMIDFHNGFGSMVQGHAHPAITLASICRADDTGMDQK